MSAVNKWFLCNTVDKGQTWINKRYLLELPLLITHYKQPILSNPKLTWFLVKYFWWITYPHVKRELGFKDSIYVYIYIYISIVHEHCILKIKTKNHFYRVNTAITWIHFSHQVHWQLNHFCACKSSVLATFGALNQGKSHRNTVEPWKSLQIQTSLQVTQMTTSNRW